MDELKAFYSQNATLHPQQVSATEQKKWCLVIMAIAGDL